MKLNHTLLAAGIATLFILCTQPSYAQEESSEALDNINSLTELASWLEKNPPEVVPLSGITGQRILSQSLESLRENADCLHSYLQSNGEIGAKWEKVLNLEDLRNAIKESTPDLETLEKIHRRFHSHQWGLEVTEIRRVAKGLNDYLLLRMNIEEEIDPADGLKEAITRLIAVLKKSNKSSFEKTTEINDIVNWLEENRQAPEVCETIRRLTVKYNLFAQMSDNLVLRFFNRPVDQTQYVSEYIVGRPQSGNVHTVGETVGKFNPDPDKINLSIVFDAVASGKMYSQSRNVTVSSSANNTLHAVKDIYFDGKQFTSAPAHSSVKIKSTIIGISSPGGLVQSAATNRVYELKPQADAEAAYKARARVESSMNKEVGAMIKKANARFNQTSELYRARGLYPDPFDCCTTEHELKFCSLVSDGIPIIQHDIPKVPEKSDLFIAVHQSAVMEYAKTMLADLKANNRVFMAIAKSMLPEDAYNELAKKSAEKNKNNDSNISGGYVYFNDQYPVNIQFTGNTVIIDIRIDAFQGKDSSSAQEIPMNLSTVYKIEKIDKNGVWFVRIKEPELIPRDFETETRKLTTQETTLRNRLQGELKDSFPEKFQIKPRKLEDMSDKDNPDAVKVTGTLKPVSAKAANGWLTINWMYQE